MEQGIGDIIRDHRNRLKITLKEMEKRTGINNGNLSKIERGQQSLTNDTMQLIAKGLGMPLSELFSVRNAAHSENLEQNGASKKNSHNFVSDFETFDQIPGDEFVAIGTVEASVDSVRGGVKVGIDTTQAHLFMGSELKDLDASKPESIGVRIVQDDMMEPRLFKGDVAVIDLASTKIPATGGVFCVVLNGETPEFRRLMTYPGGGIRIVCDNAKYPETVLDGRHAAMIEVIGRVKMVRSTAGL